MNNSLVNQEEYTTYLTEICFHVVKCIGIFGLLANVWAIIVILKDAQVNKITEHYVKHE